MGIILNNNYKKNLIYLKEYFYKIINSFRTLRLKLFITYILISTIPMFIFGRIIASSTEQQIISQRILELRSFATQIALDAINQNYFKDIDARYTFENLFLNPISVNLQSRITITDSMAIVLYDSILDIEGQMHSVPEILLALSGETFESINQNSFIHISMPIIDNDSIVGAVKIIHQMIGAFHISDQIEALSLTLSLILGSIVAIIVFLNSQWLLKPLKDILKAVQAISEGSLSQKINISRRDEFSVLANAFNDMGEKLSLVETTRQEFVSNVSHELKTPLSSIKVLSDSLLLQDNVKNETYIEFLQDITAEVDRMTNIINELLNLVRLDESESPLNIEQIDLSSMLLSIIKRLKPLANQKNIILELEVIKELIIEADEMKLTLAISNLIENAIKYTEDYGNVKIIIDSDNKNAFITVIDDGIGISEAEQPKIYSRFYRIDKGRDRDTGGTGLGLAITHKTILLHKGSIKLISREGEGSTFIARIPILASR